MPAILITLLASGIFAFRSASSEINKAYDAQLINNANILWGLMGDEIRESVSGNPKHKSPIDFGVANQIAQDEEVQQDANDYADDRMFRIWHKGKIIVSADTSATATQARQAPLGFSYEKYDNSKWRVYTISIQEQDITIEVGERMALRDDLVENILEDLFLPFLILIPIIGALTWFGIGNGLSTVRALVRQIRQRSPDNLSKVETQLCRQILRPLGFPSIDFWKNWKIH